MLPIIISLYFRQLSWGVLAAIGALAAGITDVTGPPHHRVNGILATSGFLFGSVIITLLLRQQVVALGIWLLLASFFFSYIVMYGNRAGQIGSAVLLVIVLMTDQARKIDNLWVAAGMIATGALLYMGISLLLHRARPFKLAQQVLGECLQQTGDYFTLKAGFYKAGADVNALPLQLSVAQQQISESQERVREVLFKTRSIVQESTHTGRVLLLAFLDTVDLLETIIAGQPNYLQLHKRLKETNIPTQMEQLLLTYGDALGQIGLAFQTGKSAEALPDTTAILGAIEDAFALYKAQIDSNREDISFFLEVRALLDAFYAIDRRIQLLAFYTSYDKKIDTNRSVDVKQFVLPATISLETARLNLSWQSNIMRYAVRVSLALMAGYIASLLLPLGHDYWLLLTILVILKPAYSITARRNRDRLLGTALGVGIGFLILWWIASPALLMVLMLIAMTGAFSFMRNRYFISVVLVTVFVLIAFRLLRAGDLTVLITDRLLDTFIGSVVSFLFMWFIPPLWERQRIGAEAAKCLHACKAYLQLAVQYVYTESILQQQYKYLRKQAFVQFANFSDAFQRMNQEPQWLQGNGQLWYQLVVNCNALIANIASLSNLHRNDYVASVIEGIVAYEEIMKHQLQRAVDSLDGVAMKQPIATGNDEVLATAQLQHAADQLFEKRMQELRAGAGQMQYRDRLKVIKQLETTMNNLQFICRDIELIVLKLSATAASSS